MSEWKVTSSIEAVIKELRSAIFWAKFGANASKTTGDKTQEQISLQGACGFVEFGVRAKLLDPLEANDWLDAIWDRKTLAEVSMKYEML